jgi:hypothetical protein
MPEERGALANPPETAAQLGSEAVEVVGPHLVDRNQYHELRSGPSYVRWPRRGEQAEEQTR